MDDQEFPQLWKNLWKTVLETTPLSPFPMPDKSLWSLLQKQLRQQLDPEEYATWFSPLKARAEGDKLVLLAPDSRFLHRLEEGFRPQVDRALAGLDGQSFEVLFSIDDRPEPVALPAVSEPITPGQFNPRYLFSSFVVGKSNEFAHAAAWAVAQAPSESYNPLFLYGGVGLGKTHLLHAIGTHIQTHHPEFRIAYLAAEQFVNELINSIRFDRMPAFRERYRTIDVLLIDDIQFLANKERTQEEFFHTFNTLYTSQKQIILSSDSSPRNIPTLEERLRSRFEWGLIADIQPPEHETKVAILRRKADLEDIALPDDVAHFVARQARSNIRELEGLLNRVIAFASLTGKPLSRELAEETQGPPPRLYETARWRGDHQARGPPLRLEGLGDQEQEQLEADRLPAPGRHVSAQEAHHPLLPGDRQAVQRQAPFDGDVLGRQDRAVADDRRRSRPGPQVHRAALLLSLFPPEHTSCFF
jgi:chromosomal replication initiator protein